MMKRAAPGGCREEVSIGPDWPLDQLRLLRSMPMGTASQASASEAATSQMVV
jgi:hypothetical protein